MSWIFYSLFVYTGNPENPLFPGQTRGMLLLQQRGVLLLAEAKMHIFHIYPPCHGRMYARMLYKFFYSPPLPPPNAIPELPG